MLNSVSEHLELRNILIYCDEGVSRVFLSDLIDLFPCFNVELVNSDVLLHESWEPNTRLLIIPGGRDLPYLDKLGLQFGDRLRNFLESYTNVSIIGICAGAYFASKELAFCPLEEPSACMDVFGERLNLIPVKAIGPIFKGEFSYTSNEGAHILPIETDVGVLWMYYNGGCIFEYQKRNFREYVQVNHFLDTVLATYHGKPIIISSKLSNGNSIILSGVHYEVSHNNTNLFLSKEQAAILESSQVFRKNFIDNILQELVGLGRSQVRK